MFQQLIQLFIYLLFAAEAIMIVQRRHKIKEAIKVILYYNGEE